MYSKQGSQETIIGTETMLGTETIIGSTDRMTPKSIDKIAGRDGEDLGAA